ncbi:HK97 family phage prohead protease [Edaphobacter sp. DSM 109919]|uniref:HK97 family phage prohead protease n=1 Tax=Edaphobacter paludis TaxID=3035702 RepID=A0AAU7CTY0_9BACT
MNSKNKQEIRTLPAKELRIAPVAADGTRTLTGRAIVFNQRSQDLGGFQEIVSPGAVTETLSGSPNILLLNNHNTSQPLASVRAGNLQLTTDSKGVSFRCKLDTRISYANDLALSVENGVTQGCSFGFRTLKDSYANENGTLVRTLETIELLELTVTTCPAYLQTQVDVRSCPKELRSLLTRSLDDEDDEDEDGPCDDPDCEACINGDYADCPNRDDDDDDEDEDRSLSKSEVRRLEMRLALAKLR